MPQVMINWDSWGIRISLSEVKFLDVQRRTTAKAFVKDIFFEQERKRPSTIGDRRSLNHKASRLSVDDAVGSGSGMCQAGCPGDDDSRADAFPVGTDTCKARFVGDDAVGNDSGMCKRRKCSLLDELDIFPELKEWLECVDRRPC